MRPDLDELVTSSGDEPAPPPDELVTAAAGPVPVLEGTFAIYNDPSGALVIATNTSTYGQRTDVLPAKMVKLAQLAAASGGRMPGLGKLFGKG
jgi:hypothetical protein